MRKRNCGFLTMAAPLLLILPGCQSQVTETPVQRTQLSDQISTSLADLLALPRAELAEKYADLAEQVDVKRRSYREGKTTLQVADYMAPLVIPVFREAKMSARVGFSLPPYAPEGAKDRYIALCLARFGDSEAASKLIDSGDADAQKQIESSRYEKNYPVEWTRYVALLLFSAEFQLATDDADGGTALIAFHKQLNELLDEKAKKGALGATLLPQGKKALLQAASHWRQGKLPELAAEAEKFASEWGQVSGDLFAIPFGASEAEVSHILRSNVLGCVVPAGNTLRAVDLLGIPFPDEGMELVIAQLDETKHLSDIFVTYRSGIKLSFSTPARLAQLLVERGYPSQELAKKPVLQQTDYRLPEGHCLVTLAAQGAGLGALLQVSKDSANRVKPEPNRDFGLINFERSFEQNRILLAPNARSDEITADDPQRLAQIKNPLPGLQIAKAIIGRVPNQNLLSSMELIYNVGSAGLPALHNFIMPIWSKNGPPIIQDERDSTGGHLVLGWKDAITDYQVMLPYESSIPARFLVTGLQGERNLAQRAAAVAKFDDQERKERWTSKKPTVRLDREIQGFALGMPRAKVQELLPKGRTALRRDMTDGITVTLAGEAEPNDLFIARQIYIRFGEDDKVVEVRARYFDGPAAKNTGSWVKKRVEDIAKRAGAPMPIPATWSNLWAGATPARHRAAELFWQDDLTVTTLQYDDAGAELRVRDCPLDHPNGVPLRPLESLPTGVPPLELRLSSSELAKKLEGMKPETTSDGGAMVHPQAGSPYDLILVYSGKSGVGRILARHATGDKKRTNPAEWAQALNEAAGRQIAAFGWPCRQDLTNRGILQAMGWHDDATQIRIFWSESNSGAISLFTEWKDLLAQ
jgi:hypothetical protein